MVAFQEDTARHQRERVSEGPEVTLVYPHKLGPPHKALVCSSIFPDIMLPTNRMVHTASLQLIIFDNLPLTW